MVMHDVMCCDLLLYVRSVFLSVHKFRNFIYSKPWPVTQPDTPASIPHVAHNEGNQTTNPSKPATVSAKRSCSTCTHKVCSYMVEQARMCVYMSESHTSLTGDLPSVWSGRQGCVYVALYRSSILYLILKRCALSLIHMLSTRLYTVPKSLYHKTISNHCITQTCYRVLYVYVSLPDWRSAICVVL